MHKLFLLITSNCLICLICCKQEPETINNSKQPNFIIIMADDLGYTELSCYGSQTLYTPHIDQMAKDGLRFTDFHSNGAVCSPTRAALMTGRYQQRTGVTGVITAKNHRDDGLPLIEQTFAEILKSEGYSTGLFGKWHLGYNEIYSPLQQGFDEFTGFVSGNIDYHSHVDQEGYQDWWQQDQLADQVGYSTHLITNSAIDFIKRYRDKPFMLFISHEAPHYPYQGIESKPDRSAGDNIGVDFNPQGSEEDYMAMYKEMVEIMDADIGKTLKVLKEMKLDSNTLVIFCSDNGYAQRIKSDSILRAHKGTVWEGGTRVPAIAQWKGKIAPNSSTKELVLTMDLFPTLLEFSNIPIPHNVDGISIAKTLITGQPLKKRNLFWQHNESYATRKGAWKLVKLNTDNKAMLFDLENDLREQNDLSESHPEVVLALQTELTKWKDDVFSKN